MSTIPVVEHEHVATFGQGLSAEQQHWPSICAGYLFVNTRDHGKRIGIRYLPVCALCPGTLSKFFTTSALRAKKRPAVKHPRARQGMRYFRGREQWYIPRVGSYTEICREPVCTWKRPRITSFKDPHASRVGKVKVENDCAHPRDWSVNETFLNKDNAARGA